MSPGAETKSFLRALMHWKGSLWKGVAKQLGIWLICYYAIRMWMVHCAPDPWRSTIRSTIHTFDSFTNRIPLQFLLGFYVVQIVTRWWAQVQAMPYPDEVLSTVNALLYESDDDSKTKRLTINRYIIASFIIAWRKASSAVAFRYPSIRGLVKRGLLSNEEADILETVEHEDCQFEYPLHWAYEVLRRKLGGDKSSFAKDLNLLRMRFRTLFTYEEVPIPLVYTQTAAAVVYGYFGFCLIGHQYVAAVDRGRQGEVDLMFPFLTVLQFIFSVGWLNVAEDLCKPFGDDENDVRVLEMLKRHVQYAFAVAGAPKNLPLATMSSHKPMVLDVAVLFGDENHVDVVNKSE